MHETLRIRNLPATYKTLSYLLGTSNHLFISIIFVLVLFVLSMLHNILFYFQPHSLDGIKMSKDRKKNSNHEVDGNQKLESNDNIKTHNKEHKCGTRTRRKSGEILTVASPATSYAQVIIAKDLRIIICCKIMYNNV